MGIGKKKWERNCQRIKIFRLEVSAPWREVQSTVKIIKLHTGYRRKMLKHFFVKKKKKEFSLILILDAFLF